MAGLRKRGVLTKCTSYVTFTSNIYIKKNFRYERRIARKGGRTPFLDEKSYMKTYAFHIDVSLLQNVKSTLQCLQKTSRSGFNCRMKDDRQ